MKNRAVAGAGEMSIEAEHGSATGRSPDGHDLLAAAVIGEAVSDLKEGLGRKASPRKRQAARAAQKFLFSADLEFWAEVLGVEAEQIRERVRFNLQDRS